MNPAVASFYRQGLKSVTSDLGIQDWQFFCRAFSQLHGLTNNPVTRKRVALIKAKLVLSLCQKRLNLTKFKHKIELVSRSDQHTGTLTHNVWLELGEEKDLPTMVIMVHHDTILSPDQSLKLKNKRLVGRTIQDDTLHLAALITVLPRISLQNKTRLLIIFTDHEENGCRGSAAVQQHLLKSISPQYPLVLLALESTGGLLAFGHRGKFSAELTRKRFANDVPAQVFTDFFVRLFDVQNKLNNSRSDSVLGKTTGVSTFGQSGPIFFAKLDFRTNILIGPDQVEKTLRRTLSEKQDATLAIKRSLGRWQTKKVKIFARISSLQLSVQSEITHPSAFNPKADETVLPPLFLIVSALLANGWADRITKIRWGCEDAANANPLEACIEFSCSPPVVRVVRHLVETFNKDYRVNNGFHSDWRLVNIVKTPGVATALTPETKRLAKDFIMSQENIITMPYMTDIARLFAATKKRGQKTYGFIYGEGDFRCLHGLEKISLKNVTDLLVKLPRLIDAMTGLGAQDYDNFHHEKTTDLCRQLAKTAAEKS